MLRWSRHKDVNIAEDLNIFEEKKKEVKRSRGSREAENEFEYVRWLNISQLNVINPFQQRATLAETARELEYTSFEYIQSLLYWRVDSPSNYMHCTPAMREKTDRVWPVTQSLRSSAGLVLDSTRVL